MKPVTREGLTFRMSSEFEDLSDEFSGIYSSSEFYNTIRQIRKGDGEKRSRKLNDLYDLFERCGLKEKGNGTAERDGTLTYEKGRDPDYYEQKAGETIRRLCITPDEDMEGKVYYAMYRQYTRFPTPEAYMLSIVNEFSRPEDPWEKDTLRLRILKQFVKYGHYLTRAGFGSRPFLRAYVKEKLQLAEDPADGMVWAELDDGVFDALGKASDSDAKNNGKYGLLKAADDLACGQFRTQGGTKLLLYLFAMVYGLTYYVQTPEGLKRNRRTDIEKRLFQDYYTNNLTRFMTESYIRRPTSYEQDPSGLGINYKNFAEVVFLYYLSRGDLDPADKIAGAVRMIDRLKAAGKDRPFGDPGEGMTFRYRNRFTPAAAGLDGEAFFSFMLENYDCNTRVTVTGPDGTRKTLVRGEMQLETEQQAAYAEYCALWKRLCSVLRRNRLILEELKAYSFGNWYNGTEYDESGAALPGHADRARQKAEDYRKRYRPSDPPVDPERFSGLMLIVERFSRFNTDYVKKELAGADGDLPDTPQRISAASVTRTALVMLYYNYFKARTLQTSGDPDLAGETDRAGRNPTLSEIYFDFSGALDPILERAFYQCMSPKVLLDILTVFSLYLYFCSGLY